MADRECPMGGGFGTSQRVLDAIYLAFFVGVAGTHGAEQYFLPLHAPAHFVF